MTSCGLTVMETQGLQKDQGQILKMNLSLPLQLGRWLAISAFDSQPQRKSSQKQKQKKPSTCSVKSPGLLVRKKEYEQDIPVLTIKLERAKT